MIEITGKCIACGKQFTVTPKLAHEADQAGCLISPCCGFPSTVAKAAKKPRHALQSPRSGEP